jgi:squalene-hopene/tetraprenyl-beta-curcumene cyclase
MISPTPEIGGTSASPLPNDAGRVRSAIAGIQNWLFSQQTAEGYWCGELEADSMLEADYIFLHVLLESGDPQRLKRALAEVLRCQNADGSWSLYPGGPGNISLAVKCYFACKLMRMKADEPRLMKAREWILAHGGVVATNTFTKIYLVYLGQYDRDAVPAIPPEIMLFPNWFYFNIYEISSWSRSIVVPLAILFDKKPFKQIDPEQGIDELFVGGRAKANLRLRWSDKLVSWRNFFLTIDRGLHWMEKLHVKPLRGLAMRRAEQWMLDRLELSDGLGAIYPAMLNAILALRALGYGEDHRLVKATEWLLAKEVRHLGDWAAKVPNTEPSGWYFEFANEFYPDTDDTAQVLLALTKVDVPDAKAKSDAAARAIRWEFAMQCRAGGWGSFDKDCTKEIFESIPFADHNAMLDVPTADITGRILEMLAAYGHNKTEPRIAQAIQFILDQQEPDGSWYGRWGVNYVYGTFLVLRGLEAIGYDRTSPAVQKAADYVARTQNADGGWGETCGTYDDPSTRGQGPSTPSQTAWGIMALVSAGRATSAEAATGVRWLISRQRPDGSWDESTGTGPARQALYTATGFPKVFYLAYHLYRQYFPLLALTSYQHALERTS